MSRALSMFSSLEGHVTFHNEAYGHHKVGRSHVDIILVCEIRNLLDILQNASLYELRT